MGTFVDAMMRMMVCADERGEKSRLICGKRAVSSYACCECVCVCVVGVALRCVVHSFKKATLIKNRRMQEDSKAARRARQQ